MTNNENKNNKLTTPIEQTFSLKGGKLTTKTSTFADRVRANKLSQEGVTQQDADDALMVPNRIGLMLDCSASMRGEKEEHLRQAGDEFIRSCNFADTSVAVHTFGKKSVELQGPLSRNAVVLQTIVQQLNANGGTPMRACADGIINSIPITRGVIVSDGQAGDWSVPFSDTDTPDTTINNYREAGIPIDTCHIGTGHGEELLKYIAKATGGIFIKFSNTGNFAQAFKYLSPTYRAMLGDGRITLKQIGADNASDTNR